MRSGNFIIAGQHFFLLVFTIQDMFNISHNFPGQEAIHLDHIKSLGFDVIFKDMITIYQQRFFKAYRFEQGIAEALIQTWKGHKIGRLIYVPQGKTTIRMARRRKRVGHHVVNEPNLGAGFPCQRVQLQDAFKIFITGCMGHHQLDRPVIQRFDELIGRFNALSLNHPGRLQKHDII